MAKPRSRVHHRAEGQVRRDALLHSRSRRLYYRSWAEQAGLHLRLNRRGDRITSLRLAAHPGMTTLTTGKSAAMVVLAAARKDRKINNTARRRWCAVSHRRSHAP